MHSKQLAMLNAALVIAAILLGWRLSAEWKQTNRSRYAVPSVSRSTAAAPAPAPTMERQPMPTGEIVAKNLFAPDRNSSVTQAEVSRPAPPVPVVFGTMNLGNH